MLIEYLWDLSSIKYAVKVERFYYKTNHWYKGLKYLQKKVTITNLYK